MTRAAYERVEQPKLADIGHAVNADDASTALAPACAAGLHCLGGVR